MGLGDVKLAGIGLFGLGGKFFFGFWGRSWLLGTFVDDHGNRERA